MEEVAKQLQQTDLFREVELVDLEALVQRMKPLSFSPGEVLFQANAPGDTMYIIRGGGFAFSCTIRRATK
ncbi:MAG: cyclic nucleotide-binding domain-containing protein [Anaerolineae bacterium]|nr:cyclic nucleotide-binding domain-containing protein [Anaerolineae bacterium]